MRILSIGLLGLAAVVGAQPAPRKLTFAPDLRIEAKMVGNQRDGLLAIGPKGQIVTTMRYAWSGVSAYDSTGKSLGWTIPTGRGDDSDIGAPAAIGWIGASDTMWVSDYGFRQFVLTDGRGKVLKSIEYPSWIHPSWSERRKYPVFSRMDPVAVSRNQTMLIVPSAPRSLIDTPGYDRSASQVFRTTWDGAIRDVVVRLPADDRGIRLHSKGCDHTINVPFATGHFWTMSPDGTRITIVRSGAAADSGAVRVTTISDRGDTVFSRKYLQTSERNPDVAITNFLNTLRPCGTFTAEELRDSASKRLSAYKSLVTGVMTGRDNSTWILTRFLSDTVRERGATILDARGDVIGEATLPLNAVPLAVGHDLYWLFELGRYRQPGAFVRYKAQATAALPARSASGAASSKPPRPPK